MKELIKDMPIIALRGMTILPYMVIHFDVSRDKSVKSVEYAMKNGQTLFLVAQKSPDVMDPERDDIFDYGTICEIKQIVKMPGGIVRVLVKGTERALLVNLTGTKGMLSGDIEPCEDGEALVPDTEKDARMSMLKEMFKRFYTESGKKQSENITRISGITGLDELTYKVIAECTLEYDERQQALDIEDILERFDFACDLICKKIEIEEIKKTLSADIKQRIEKNQKDYVLREQLQVIKEELGDDNSDDEVEKYKERTSLLEASNEIKDKIFKEIRRYETISNSSSESYVIRAYIETMLDLPWNKYTEDNNDILNAEKVLNKDHYGLAKVKERILEFLAVRALNSKGESPIICLVGPPGTGKTSIAESVARALNRKYVRICLGGVRDEAEIRGHRKTYVGAMPGRIVTGLKEAGSGNPLMLLDEIDKAGTDSRGDTASALLEVLDSAQNKAFKDHYIEAPIDLSEVMFIATANDAGTIPKPLLDRMEIIEVNSYTATEKFHIAKEHLISKQLEKNGLNKKQLSISDKAIRIIIENYTREAGVRSLERRIGEICRKAAKKILQGENTLQKITAKNITDYLGTQKYDSEEASKTDLVGVAKGLAWTSVGGTTLDVEAGVMSGKGNITLTGQLGDVMKESATVALGYVRSQAEKYNIPDEMFEKKDIYVHVPEGAVPKDGPSAGITMTLAMISAYTGRKISHDTAMTGEITLHGQVLPIGGLKEKLLAAKMTGMKKVIVPDKNRKDVNDIEHEILDGLTITYVKNMDEVVSSALR